MIVKWEALKVCIGKETRMVGFIIWPALAWDVNLGAGFFHNPKAVLTFVAGTFSTSSDTKANAILSTSKALVT